MSPRRRRPKKSVTPRPRRATARPDAERRDPSAVPTACYLCARPIASDDEIARAHELVMHRRCYEEDLRKGRSPGDPRP